MKERIDLAEVPKVSGISKEAFVRDYLKPQKPVVIADLIADWPAYQKWNLEYIREIAGDREVPLYDDRPISSKYKVNEPHTKMKMRQYIDLLQAGPTSYRI